MIVLRTGSFSSHSNYARVRDLVCHTVVALVIIPILLPNAVAQFVQQGGKLVGTGAVGGAAQGYSVALSADGNTAILGGLCDNGGACATDGAVGAAWVFTRS